MNRRLLRLRLLADPRNDDGRDCVCVSRTQTNYAEVIARSEATKQSHRVYLKFLIFAL
jgi:hypothetical protein